MTNNSTAIRLYGGGIFGYRPRYMFMGAKKEWVIREACNIDDFSIYYGNITLKISLYI